MFLRCGSCKCNCFQFLFLAIHWQPGTCGDVALLWGYAWREEGSAVLLPAIWWTGAHEPGPVWQEEPQVNREWHCPRAQRQRYKGGHWRWDALYVPHSTGLQHHIWVFMANNMFLLHSNKFKAQMFHNCVMNNYYWLQFLSTSCFHLNSPFHLECYIMIAL